MTVGQETLARQFAKQESLNTFDLEDPRSLARLAEPDLDLLLFIQGRRIGVECKRSSAPTLFPPMKTALTDLKLDHLFVVYPGDRRYALANRAEAIPLREMLRR